MSEIKGLTELEELFIRYGLYEEQCEFITKDTEYKLEETIVLNKLQYMIKSVGYVEVIKSRLINPYKKSIRVTSINEGNVIRSAMYISGIVLNGKITMIPNEYLAKPIETLNIPRYTKYGKYEVVKIKIGEGARQHMLTSPDLKLYMRDHKELLIDNLRNDLLKHEAETLERIGYNEIQNI